MNINSVSTSNLSILYVNLEILKSVSHQSCSHRTGPPCLGPVWSKILKTWQDFMNYNIRINNILIIISVKM